MTTIFSNLNAFAFLAAFIFEFLRSGLAVIMVGILALWHFQARSIPQHQRRGWALTYFFSGVDAAAAGIILDDGRRIVSMSITFLLIVFLITVAESGRSRLSPSTLLVGRIVALMLFPVLTVATLITSLQWLPLEALEIQGETEVRWAYVIAVTDYDTTLLDEDGSVMRFENGQVTARAICSNTVLKEVGKIPSREVNPPRLRLQPPPTRDPLCLKLVEDKHSGTSAK